MMTHLSQETERAAPMEAFNVLSFQEGLEARVAFGEIEGVMVAAGRYRKSEAVQIRTELYGFVWCPLSKGIVERFGDEHSMRDIWAGKTIAVQGRIHYAPGGAKITYIDGLDVREIVEAPRVNLEDILDPNFTAGMDPHEYLDKLHEGSDHMTCSDCGKDMKEGEDVCLWGDSPQGLTVRFICEDCAEKLERTGKADNITAELKN